MRSMFATIPLENISIIKELRNYQAIVNTTESNWLKKRIEELEQMNEELKRDKEDLKRDKQMLQLHIETLTTGSADKKKPD